MSSMPDRYPTIGEVTLYLCKSCDVAHTKGKVCPICGKKCDVLKVWR